MEQAVIGIGANLGDTETSFRKAAKFLEALSEAPVVLSPIYRSEPVGIADREFLNAVALIETSLAPAELLRQLKDFEAQLGRDMAMPRWSNRLIDLDIITYGQHEYEISKAGSQSGSSGTLKIPHPEYRNRLFVLLPLRDIMPGFSDPADHTGIDQLILAAPKISVSKSSLNW
jgi:2-amino-4-hydroxy-6-hydroxymethyldihydropteridine diphosphokinase